MKRNRPKAQRKVSKKSNLNFKDYKHCLEATQIENKINHLEQIILMWMIFKIRAKI